MIKLFIILTCILGISSDTFKIIDPSIKYVMPNITDPKLIRKSEEQMIFMMVTDVKNSTKYVTAFSAEIDKYAQLVIPGCKYYF